MAPPSISKTPVSTHYTVGAVSKLAFAVLLVSIIIGQVVRFPLLEQAGGILVSDVALLLLVGVVVVGILVGVIPLYVLGKPIRLYAYILPFFVFALAILLIRMPDLGFHPFLVSLLYLLRVWAISLVFPIALLVASTSSGYQFLSKCFVYTYIALLMLGYAQLLVMPSLVGNVYGWDPHIHRMVSTWFDPNFFGAFIVIGILPVLLWVRFNIPIFLLSCTALVLTGSRSSWVAFAGAGVVTLILFLSTAKLSGGWRYAMRLATLSCVIIGIVIVGVFPNRVMLLLTHDPTASLRTDAYKVVWHRLVEPNILVGVGYNAYQYSAKSAGLIADYSAHSRAGSDNSMITLLVTTGIFGTALFFIPICMAYVFHISNYVVKQRRNSLVFVWTATALLIHSQFSNSLLYAHVLLVFCIISAISFYEQK